MASPVSHHRPMTSVWAATAGIALGRQGRRDFGVELVQALSNPDHPASDSWLDEVTSTP